MDLHGFGAGVGLELLSQPFDNVRENLFQDLCSRTLLQAARGKRMPEFYDLVKKAVPVAQIGLATVDSGC